MHAATIEKLAQQSDQRLASCRRSPFAFTVSSMLAGAYVGVGIILIFVLGASVPPEWRKLVMAATFGIALTLVVVAGADLFTGHHLYGTLSWLSKGSALGSILLMWALCWVGNLLGSFLLAVIFSAGGGAGLLSSPAGLLQEVAAFKMTSSVPALLARATLCNWLVCLALWMSARVTSESARCIVIWWCLLAFIACGFEHSVANMTLLCLALLGPHGADITVAGLAHNLLWVSLGNVIGGAGFVAGSYWVMARAQAISDTVSTVAVPGNTSDSTIRGDSRR